MHDFPLICWAIVGKGDADATYWVLHDPIEEERGIGHMLAHPVRIWPLSNCPLQYVRLLDACEESVEVTPVRYQWRLFQKPTATIVRRVVIAQSTGHLLFQDKAKR